MFTIESHSSCQHDCLWAGTNHCLLHRVSSVHLAARRLSLGIRCGLRVLYDPHPLPPCVQADGELCWQSAPQRRARERWED